jgi:hypothetical protein
MKVKMFASALLVLSCALTLMGKTTKADFTGKWNMDEAQSEGISSGTKQTMTITQRGEQLIVDTKIYPSNGVAYSVKDSYMLNGKETVFHPELNGKEGVGKHTAKWLADGKSIEVSESVMFNTRQGSITAQTKRKLIMSADGKTVTIEATSKTPQGNITSKRVFIRQVLD